jgi:hypothetical protein
LVSTQNTNPCTALWLNLTIVNRLHFLRLFHPAWLGCEAQVEDRATVEPCMIMRTLVCSYWDFIRKHCNFMYSQKAKSIRLALDSDLVETCHKDTTVILMILVYCTLHLSLICVGKSSFRFMNRLNP